GCGRPLPCRARTDSPLAPRRARLRARPSRGKQCDARGPRAQSARRDPWPGHRSPESTPLRRLPRPSLLADRRSLRRRRFGGALLLLGAAASGRHAGGYLSDRQGRTTSALVRLPSLEIIEPRGEVRVPYGGTAPGVSVGPRGAGRGMPQVAGLKAAPREQAAVHVLVSGRTDPGNRVEVDGVVVPVARAGEFSREVPLHVGENGIALVVRDPIGALRVANLVVRVLDHAEEGRDVVVVERIPHLTVALPPAASVLSSRELRLSGQTGPGHRVWANAESLHVDDDGAFSGTVTLPEGKSSLKLAVEDAEGHRGEIDRPIDVRSKRLFLVALADGVIGKTTGSALRGAGQSEGVWTEGRLAYHLK